MIPQLAPYAKAVVGALVAGLTSLGTALTDGSVNASEWVSVALAFLLGLGIVYAAPKNAPKTPRNDHGFIDRGILYVLAAVALTLCILALLGVNLDLNAR